MLAEIDGLSKYFGTGWGILVAIVAVAGGYAVMRYRMSSTEKKNSEQDGKITDIGKLTAELPLLFSTETAKMSTRIEDRIDKSERNTNKKLVDLEKTLIRKIDNVREKQSVSERDVAVLKTEVDHLKA